MRDRIKGICSVGLLLSLLIVLTVGLAWADDDRLKQAAGLRDASSVDFNEKRHADAAEKLRQAAVIYSSLPEPPIAELAVTLRALVWNEYLAGQIDECGVTFERLVVLLKEQPDYASEVDSAWGAIFKAAKSKESFKEAEAFLARARYAAKNAGLLRLAAQITHDIAAVAAEKGEPAAAVTYLEDAIVQREEIGDRTGLAWSLNNLAHRYLTDLDDLEEGMAAIVEAHAILHGEGVLEVQTAVSWNIRKALELAHDYRGKLDPILKGIDALIEEDEACGLPESISLPWLYRQRLALTVRIGRSSSILKAATALSKAKLEGYPDESRADLALAATETMIAAGKPSKARSWLRKVECGEGPAAAHLKARLATARALLAADAKKRKDFIEYATHAASAWESLEDWQGERDALKALCEAAAIRDYSVDISEVNTRWNKIRGLGSPGGAGSSAMSSGDRNAADSLKLTDALFEVTFEEGKIVLRDVSAEVRQDFKMVWTPNTVAMNGLALATFGGFVAVRSFDYGGSASAGGNPGSIRLADFGDYLPVPATGALVIQKNGGIRYRR